MRPEGTNPAKCRWCEPSAPQSKLHSASQVDPGSRSSFWGPMVQRTTSSEHIWNHGTEPGSDTGHLPKASCCPASPGNVDVKEIRARPVLFSFGILGFFFGTFLFCMLLSPLSPFKSARATSTSSTVRRSGSPTESLRTTLLQLGGGFVEHLSQKHEALGLE